MSPDAARAGHGRSSNELGQHLRLLRVKNKLTMVQAAAISGVTQGYISQIENGLYQPSAKVLAKLARAYKVQEVQLLRKAGIVDQGTLDRLGLSPAVLEPELAERDFEGEPGPEQLGQLLRRNLALLELIADHQRNRSQAAGLPAAESPSETPAADAQEYSLPLYDNEWRPVVNANGEPSGLRLPASLCNFDPEAFILCVEDGSMEPLINSGDWVIISPATDPEPGQVAAVNDNNRIHLRQYMPVGDNVALVPLNSLYASGGLLEGDLREGVDVLGRVLRLVNRDL